MIQKPKARIQWLIAPAVLLIATLGSNGTAQAEEFNDEFDNPKSLAGWKIRDSVEGGEKTYEKIEIGTSRDGWLSITPRAGNGWYKDGMGPMVYKEFSGDFLVETSVITESRNADGRPPQAQYNSAGLIVRDPASKRGTQNWFVVNVGNQARFTGSEAKTTVNSDSHLELQRGSHNGRLRLARIGTMVYALRMLDGEDKWTIIREVDRSDLPKRVQVGLIANGWSRQGDLVAHYDYIRISVPQRKSDLTSAK